VFQIQKGIEFHLLVSPDPGIFVLRNILSPPLSVGAAGRQVAGNFFDESRHLHAFCDQACAGLMHRGQKFVAGIVNACDLSHVDFDFFAGAQSRAPNIFRFANPGAAKPACEFHAALPAILMERDS
jgi:hypothetical protein